MDKAFALFGKLSLGIFIAAILVGGGIYLGVKQNKVLMPSPSPVPTQIPKTSYSPVASAKPQSPSPQATSNQTVVVNGSDPFVSFSAVIPNGWETKKEIIVDRTKITFSNGTTMLIISQAAGGGGGCVYPGDQPSNFSSSFNSPTQIQGSTSNFRRATATQGSIVGNSQIFTVCEEKTNNYQFPTQFGYITYQTDVNPSSQTLQALDQIVASLKKQ